MAGNEGESALALTDSSEVEAAVEVLQSEERAKGAYEIYRFASTEMKSGTKAPSVLKVAMQNTAAKANSYKRVIKSAMADSSEISKMSANNYVKKLQSGANVAGKGVSGTKATANSGKQNNPAQRTRQPANKGHQRGVVSKKNMGNRLRRPIQKATTAKGAVAASTRNLSQSTTKIAGTKSLKSGAKATGKIVKHLKIAGKAVAKSAKFLKVAGVVAKKIPGVSVVCGVGFAVYEASKGNWGRAGLEVVSGVAGCFPPAGTAVSLAIDSATIAYDSVGEAKKGKIQGAAMLAKGHLYSAADAVCDAIGAKVTKEKYLALANDKVSKVADNTLVAMSPKDVNTILQKRGIKVSSSNPGQYTIAKTINIRSSADLEAIQSQKKKNRAEERVLTMNSSKTPYLVQLRKSSSRA